MVEINNKTKARISRAHVRRLAESFMSEKSLAGRELSVVIAGDALLRRLNREYRGIDKTTDVLSFAGDSKRNFLGEIFINLREAGKTEKYDDVFSVRPSKAYLFDFLLVHGLLHLVGYDDKSEKGRLEMIRLGADFLRRNKMTGRG